MVHIPTLTCGCTVINPCPLTLTCVFAFKNPFHCTGAPAQFPIIPHNCPCGLVFTSLIPSAQSFQSGETPILITTVEEDFFEEFTGTATNVLVVHVPLFTSSQYLSYKELLAKPGAHLTFCVDNDNWLSVAYVIKQLLEQGISLTTDPYPPSPKSPSSPDSHPSMADNSVCLPRLDYLALAQHNVDELKYESARLAQQIQQLSSKLNVPHSHTGMAPELVHTNSNHPCTKPQANISRSEFVPQDLDSSATDPISESMTMSQVYCPHSLTRKRKPLVTLRSYNKPVMLFIQNCKTPSLVITDPCHQTLS